MLIKVFCVCFVCCTVWKRWSQQQQQQRQQQQEQQVQRLHSAGWETNLRLLFRSSASCKNILSQSLQSFTPPSLTPTTVPLPIRDIKKLSPPHSYPPKSEIRADLSHTPCSTCRLLSCCPPRLLRPPPRRVCICCRPSTVKSCNIFAKIFIHQPGLRHCRVNEQQLLARSKWILPARYPT